MSGSPYGAGDLTVYTNHLTCRGDELSLDYCTVEDSTESTCDITTVVGVVCQGKLTPLCQLDLSTITHSLIMLVHIIC